MMLELWGRGNAYNVQKPLWLLAELGLECKRLDVGGAFGGTDTLDYLAMNPMGLVPTLQDGEVTLFESCAIVRYLGASYGDNNFWPTDPAKRAELDQWAEWAKGALARNITYEIFWSLVRTKKADRDMDALAAGLETAAKLTGMLDKRLGDGPYLGGEHLSFADIIIAHVLYRYYTLEIERSDTPNLDAYYKRLCGRPAFVEHVMIDYSSLKVE